MMKLLKNHWMELLAIAVVAAFWAGVAIDRHNHNQATPNNHFAEQVQEETNQAAVDATK